MKQELIKQMEKLLKLDDLSEEQAAEVELLLFQYENIMEFDADAVDEEGDASLEEQASEDEINQTQEGESKEAQTAVDDAEDRRFKEIKNIYQTRKEKKKAIDKEAELERLNKRDTLLEALKELSEKTISPKQAFDKYHEIKDAWNELEVGNSNRSRKQLASFNVIREQLFYNIDIYKALREHDLQKNLELKQEVIRKIGSLVEVDSIKQKEAFLQQYRNEWSDIGPTFNEKWEEVKKAYYDAIGLVDGQVNEHYKGIREDQQKNISGKRKVIEELENLINKDSKDLKFWNATNDLLKDIWDKWNELGFAGKEHEALWGEFKGLRTKLIEEKNQFFDQLKGQRSENELKKKELIEKAEKLKDSKDWKNSSNTFIQLQKDWKKVGATFRGKEQKFWKQFRAAADHFFEQKKQYFATLDDRKAENLKTKETLLNDLKAFESSKNETEDLKQLSDIASNWQAIHPIPQDKIRSLADAFNRVLEQALRQAGLPATNAEAFIFKTKLDGWITSERAFDLLKKERQFLKKKLNEKENDLERLENNMGFFGDSKGVQALLKDVKKKVAKAEKQRDSIKQKLKLLKSAETKLRSQEARSPE